MDNLPDHFAFDAPGSPYRYGDATELACVAAEKALGDFEEQQTRIDTALQRLEEWRSRHARLADYGDARADAAEDIEHVTRLAADLADYAERLAIAAERRL